MIHDSYFLSTHLTSKLHHQWRLITPTKSRVVCVGVCWAMERRGKERRKERTSERQIGRNNGETFIVERTLLPFFLPSGATHPPAAAGGSDHRSPSFRRHNFDFELLSNLQYGLLNMSFDIIFGLREAYLIKIIKVVMYRHMYQADPKDCSEIQYLPFSHSGIVSLYRSEPKEPT